MSQGRHRIRAKTTLAPGITQFELAAPLIARKNRPGQFLILRLDDAGERIPLTIVEADPERGTVTIIVQEVGKTIRQLGRMAVGDQVRDVVIADWSNVQIHNHPLCVVVVCVVCSGLEYSPACEEVKERGGGFWPSAAWCWKHQAKRAKLSARAGFSPEGFVRSAAGFSPAYLLSPVDGALFRSTGSSCPCGFSTACN